MFLPNTQGLKSNTYVKPPLQPVPTLTIPDLYDWHAQHSPDHPLFVFDDPKNAGKLETIVWKDAVAAIHRAAHLVSTRLSTRAVGNRRPVVAILASADTITYFCLIVGILRANYAVFPISPRNTAEAVAHLLDGTDVTHIVVSNEPAINALVTSALRLAQNSAIQTLDMLLYTDLFPTDGNSRECVPFKTQTYNMDDAALISHSSGSCSFPKPITWSHGALVQLAYAPYFGDMDMCGLVVGIHAVPMFHGMGHTQMLLVATAGNSLGVFKPSNPPTIPTPENVFAGIVASKSDLTGSVPAFIEAWSKNPAKVAVLKSIKGLIYGGGPLNKNLGDSLAAQGVAIYVTYASTEVGLMSTYFRAESPGMDWEYFTFSEHVRPVLIPYGDSDDIFEVVIQSHDIHKCAVITTSIDGRNTYATNDLVTSHPVKKGYYKVYGRVDDQIMLSTGEKTNPGPLEAILDLDPRVRGSVIFGRGQFQNGVLVDPQPEYLASIPDEDSLARFRNEIWPTVEKMNAAAPTHSRIFKEMIILSSPGKPFIYTPKGTVRRHSITTMYETEIQAAYDAVASTTRSSLEPPADWSFENTLEFIRSVIHNVMIDITCADDDDLFHHGCDSLQATWIRNLVIRVIRETIDNEAALALPESMVYQHPTIYDLASFISESLNYVMVARSPSRGTEEAAHEGDETRRLAEVQAMIEKYSNFSKDLQNDHVDLQTEQQTTLSTPSKEDALAKPARSGILQRWFSAVTQLGWKKNARTPAVIRPKVSPSSSSFDHGVATGDVILITGTTRGFGSALLRQLIRSDQVSRIYALNRQPRNGRTLLENQLASLRLPGSVLPEKLTLLLGNLALTDLGLGADVYTELRRTVTHVIHNGWTVDFKLALSSFESQVQGLRSLINLAISSTKPSCPRLLFVSTIGVFQHPLKNRVLIPESHIDDPRMVIGMGYSEAKYVGEQILAKATGNTALRPIIVRLGQICGGGGDDGYHWNEKEWFPSIVRSAFELGCLPDADWPLSWTPAESAARALFEMRDSSHQVLHLVHPKPTSWSTIMRSVASILDVPLVPYADWLHCLSVAAEYENENPDTNSKTSHPITNTNPALRLLDAFRQMQADSTGFVDLATRLAVESSRTLKELPKFGEGDVKRWVDAWKKTGFIPPRVG